MTQPASTPSSTGVIDRLRTQVEKVLPPSRRETIYRVVTAAITGLVAAGDLSANHAAIWTQVGLATVTLLFALLYAPTTWRATLYTLVVAVGAVLTTYGLAKGVDWALIVSSIGYALGTATAAAKAQQPEAESSDEAA